MKPATLVVTGGSRGIGKATIELFQQQGWRVINLSRRNCELDDVININVDLSVVDWQQQVKPQLDVMITEPQRICLVHNAALSITDNVDSLDVNQLRTLMEVNVIAPISLNQLLLANMDQGSSIIYVGSTLSEKAVPGSASYTITKHALIGLMRTTCQDITKPGLHTCCICPGFTETEMLMDIMGNDSATIAAVTENVTAKRLIQPSEIASLVHYCAENPVINGSVLHANLGQVEH